MSMQIDFKTILTWFWETQESLFVWSSLPILRISMRSRENISIPLQSCHKNLHEYWQKKVEHHHNNLSILSSNAARDNRLTICSIGSRTPKFSHSKLVGIISLMYQKDAHHAPSCLSEVHSNLVDSTLRLRSHSVKTSAPWGIKCRKDRSLRRFAWKPSYAFRAL